MADELLPVDPSVDVVVDAVVEPVVELVVEPVLEPLPVAGIEPEDVVLISPAEGGNLVMNNGRLLWVSPNGTRTIIAGA